MEFSDLVKVEYSNFRKWNKTLAQNKLKYNNMSNLPFFSVNTPIILKFRN